MLLNDQIAARIKTQYEKLNETGEILSEEKLKSYYDLFRQKFGPEILSNLDGEELLNLMHDSSNHNSLVYWLEFKNDEEFPYRFGSIAGGSSLKFGIYRRKETGSWVTGSPQNQVTLTTEQAIAIARKHRDQLLQGAIILSDLPIEANNSNYAVLQNDLSDHAPDISNSAWGHKYFSLLFPDKLDNFHNPNYQRFHLLKMLQIPVENEGRYSVAGQYMAISRELGMHINNLSRTLWELDSQPHQYWNVRVDLSEAGEGSNYWEEMVSMGYIGIGWQLLGDLSNIQYNHESLNQVKVLMEEKYHEKGGYAQEIFNFLVKISIGDIVVAIERKNKEDIVQGIGRVTSSYIFQPGLICNRHNVDWLSLKQYKLQSADTKNRNVYALSSYSNIVDIEQRLLSNEVTPSKGKTPLTGIPAHVQDILERKRQVILYGPPGTGKTHWAYQSAKSIAAHNNFGQDFNSLSPQQMERMNGDIHTPGLVQFCTFHPSYGYEDFIEGYKPNSSNGNLVFELRPGIFKRLTLEALSHPESKYILIIDEINRGDIPRIFGELITLLEKNKRGITLPLPVSGEAFTVPDNVYIIGTMNTADRSIALLDTALRRRFGFIELMPDSSVFGITSLDGIPLGAWLDTLNRRILESVGKDARNLQIGHAYLLDKGYPINDFPSFMQVLQEDIFPLLEEYCYEDYDTLEKIIGNSLVDKKNQRIRLELFQPSRHDELIQALLSSEITTSNAAIKSDQIINSVEEGSEDIS
jgi:5-methylcytosine-specific restriction enzyme B